MPVLLLEFAAEFDLVVKESEHVLGIVELLVPLLGWVQVLVVLVQWVDFFHDWLVWADVQLLLEELYQAIVLLLVCDHLQILLVELLDLLLQHLHLLDQVVSRLVQALDDQLLICHGLAQIQKDLLSEKDGVPLDEVGLVEAVVLEGLHGQVVDVRVVVGLVLPAHLSALQLSWVLLAKTLAGGTFLDVLRDVLADAAYAAKLSLIIALALQNLLEKRLKPLHGDDLQVGIRCQALEPGPVLLRVVILPLHLGLVTLRVNLCIHLIFIIYYGTICTIIIYAPHF